MANIKLFTGNKLLQNCSWKWLHTAVTLHNSCLEYQLWKTIDFIIWLKQLRVLMQLVHKPHYLHILYYVINQIEINCSHSLNAYIH